MYTSSNLLKIYNRNFHNKLLIKLRVPDIYVHMKKLYITVLIAFCASFFINLTAFSQQKQQRWFDRRKHLFLNQLVLSANLSSMGIGLEASTALSDHFMIRAGIDYFPKALGIPDDIRINDDILKGQIQGNYYPDYHVKFKPDMLHGHVVVDYYPNKFKNFFVSAGLYVGVTEIKAEGYLINPETGERSVLRDPKGEWPTLRLRNQRLNIDGGQLNASIRLGEIVKPYIGIGYGRAIPRYKNDWGYRFELGFLIQPTDEIRQGGDRAPVDYTSPVINIDKYFNWVKVWPVLNCRVTFRAK